MVSNKKNHHHHESWLISWPSTSWRYWISGWQRWNYESQGHSISEEVIHFSFAKAGPSPLKRPWNGMPMDYTTRTYLLGSGSRHEPRHSTPIFIFSLRELRWIQKSPQHQVQRHVLTSHFASVEYSFSFEGIRWSFGSATEGQKTLLRLSIQRFSTQTGWPVTPPSLFSLPTPGNVAGRLRRVLPMTSFSG